MKSDGIASDNLRKQAAALPQDESVAGHGSRTASIQPEALLARALERPNLQRALKQVRQNKGAPGIDGMSVDDLPRHLKEHWPEIRAQLVAGTYRPLLEPGSDVFVRYNAAISILKKVQLLKEESIMNQISSRKPFGLPTTFKGMLKPFEGAVKLYQNGGVGFVKKSVIPVNMDWVAKHKVLIPRAGSGSDSFPHPILGKPFAVGRNTACTETYMVAGVFKSKREAEQLVSYICTRFFRFMVLLSKSTQDATSKVYRFVPVQKLPDYGGEQ